MTKNKLSYYFFILLLFITSLQFSPIGLDENYYDILRLFIIGGIGILFMTTFKSPIRIYREIPLLKTHTFYLFISSVVVFVLHAFGADASFSPLRDLLISLVILMIGINMELNLKQFKTLITVFIVFYTISALSIVFTYAPGFVIQEQYLAIPKNQLAPVYGVSVIIALYFAFKQKGIGKWIYYSFAVLLLASLLVIRGRAVIVAVFFTTLIFIVYYIRNIKYQFIIVVLIMISLPFIGQYIYDSLFLNYDITDLDSISTGRMERNVMGVEFFLKYPIAGELRNLFKGSTIHNYILITLVSYGAFIGSLILIIYFKYIMTVIKSIRNNTFKLVEVAPLAMLVLLIVSLFEYTYPYAPGSAVFFPFFLMGQYLKSRDKIRSK